MIHTRDNQMIATFGTGDIGTYTLLGEDGIPKIGFANQESREIGEVADFKKGTLVNEDNFDILFEFYKVESIDVVINMLQELKKEFNR